MRLLVLLICGGLAACASNSYTVPSTGVYEVPQAGSASTYGGGDAFTETIESSLAEGDGTAPANVALAPSATGTGAALDDDRINLMQWTLAQQKVEARLRRMAA